MIAEWFFSLPSTTKIVSLYFIVITLMTFFYFGYDKMKSLRENERRVSEKTLWLLSLIGGSLGALLGMHYFRHKTKKMSFQAVMAVILAGQVGIIVWVMETYG